MSTGNSMGEKALTTAGALLGPMRLPFLLLCPACVSLGVAAAAWQGAEIDWLLAFWVLIGALAAHIGVNALNEYDDFRTGLDFHTRRTPFSGGSGTLPSRPDMAAAALMTGLGALAVTAGLGAWFVALRGPGLIPVGVAGIALAISYTRWLTRHPLACLIAPGLGFGPLMVMGTEFVLSGGYSQTGWLVSLVPFFLVSDLLLLNQFPDVEADRAVGRRHLPLLLGRRAGAGIYAVLLAGTYLTVAVAVPAGRLPTAALLALIPIPLAVRTVFGALRYATDTERLTPHLAANVVLTLTTPVLLAVGIYLGS